LSKNSLIWFDLISEYTSHRGHVDWYTASTLYESPHIRIWHAATKLTDSHTADFHRGTWGNFTAPSFVRTNPGSSSSLLSTGSTADQIVQASNV
jgi:hypothetical protein